MREDIICGELARSHKQSPDSGSGRPGEDGAVLGLHDQHMLRIPAPQTDRKLTSRSVRRLRIRVPGLPLCSQRAFGTFGCFWRAKETAALWAVWRPYRNIRSAAASASGQPVSWIPTNALLARRSRKECMALSSRPREQSHEGGQYPAV